MIKSYGIFNVSKVQNLIYKIEREQITTELDQMVLVGILSTQLLHKWFTIDPIVVDFSNLNNYKITNIS